MSYLKLKPCPFCGGVATQVFSVNAETYVYGCYTQGCMGNAHNNLHRYETDKEAVEAWNKRTGYPCDLCEYGPTSGGDGKPCSQCPASRRLDYA